MFNILPIPCAPPATQSLPSPPSLRRVFPTSCSPVMHERWLCHATPFVPELWCCVFLEKFRQKKNMMTRQATHPPAVPMVGCVCVCVCVCVCARARVHVRLTPKTNAQHAQTKHSEHAQTARSNELRPQVPLSRQSCLQELTLPR